MLAQPLPLLILQDSVAVMRVSDRITQPPPVSASTQTFA
jgi:hypothetical protein